MAWATVLNPYHSVIVWSSENHEQGKTHIYMYIYIYIHTHIHIYIHCIYILALTYIYTYLHLPTNTYLQMHTCKLTYAHTHLHANTCTLTHIHTLTYTILSHDSRGYRSGFQPCRFRFNCLRVSSGHWYLKTSSARLKTLFTPVP